MNSQPTLFLNLTGSTSNGSKPATSRWIWLLLATVLYYSSKTIIQNSPRVAFFANHHVNGKPFEYRVSSHLEDNLKLFNSHFEVHGPRGSPHKLVRRSPQNPGPVAQGQTVDVVDLTLGDSPLVINIEDEEDGLVHVITIIGFDENSQPIFAPNIGTSSEGSFNSSTTVTVNTTVATETNTGSTTVGKDANSVSGGGVTVQAGSATLDAGAKSTGAVANDPFPNNSTFNGTAIVPGGTAVSPGGTPPSDTTPQPGAATTTPLPGQTTQSGTVDRSVNSKETVPNNPSPAFPDNPTTTFPDNPTPNSGPFNGTTVSSDSTIALDPGPQPGATVDPQPSPSGNPTVPNPTVPNPTVPNPTVPNPTVPNPTVPNPTVPNPNVQTNPIPQTVAVDSTSLNLGPAFNGQTSVKTQSFVSKCRQFSVVYQTKSYYEVLVRNRVFNAIILDPAGNKVKMGSLFGDNGILIQAGILANGRRLAVNTFRRTMSTRVTQNTRLTRIVELIRVGAYGSSISATFTPIPTRNPTVPNPTVPNPTVPNPTVPNPNVQTNPFPQAVLVDSSTLNLAPAFKGQTSARTQSFVSKCRRFSAVYQSKSVSEALFRNKVFNLMILDQAGNQVKLGSLFGDNGILSQAGILNSGRLAVNTFGQATSTRVTQNTRLTRIVELIRVGAYGSSIGATFTPKPTVSVTSATVGKLPVSQTFSGAAIQLKGIPKDVTVRQFSSCIPDALRARVQSKGIPMQLSQRVNQIREIKVFTTTYSSVNLGFREGLTSKLTQNSRMALLAKNMINSGASRQLPAKNVDPNLLSAKKVDPNLAKLVPKPGTPKPKT